MNEEISQVTKPTLVIKKKKYKERCVELFRIKGRQTWCINTIRRASAYLQDMLHVSAV